MATALGSTKLMPKYIFVLFDIIQASSNLRRLQQLLLKDSASIQATSIIFDIAFNAPQHGYRVLH